MKFCALTKKEVESLSFILDKESISYQIEVDSEIVDANEESMKFNLRHLNAPSISTAVLSIEVDDLFWDQLSESSVKKLADLGFSPINVEDIEAISPLSEGEGSEPLRSVLNRGSKRLIGTHFLVYFIVIGSISFLIRYFS